MKAPNFLQKSRIDLIDALRGSALLGILLLHSVEHWDFERYPKNSPGLLKALDYFAHEIVFFLFGGKAYGIFALLFGVSTWLIFESWSRRGVKFEGRYLWRLSLLAVMGYLHGLVFCGDVLLIIAVLGLPLVFFVRLSNRMLAWISVLLVLQLPSCWETARVLFEPGFQAPAPRNWAIYNHLLEVYAGGSFVDVLKTNLWTGQFSRIWWTIETGRYLQMLGLFIWGVLLGRARIFEDLARSVWLAKRAVLLGALLFAIVFPLKLQLKAAGLPGLNGHAVINLLSSYCNLAQLVLWAGGFVLLYQWTKARLALQSLAPYGRMSLSSYVTQGLIGVPVFYGYGLAMYQHWGVFYSLLFGCGLALIQIVGAHLWLKSFKQGPLEALWRSLTFINSGTYPEQRKAVKPLVEPARVPARTPVYPRGR